MKLGQLSELSFSNVKLPSGNYCLTKSKELMAEENTSIATDIDPSSIATSVINNLGHNLSPRERRGLPYFIQETQFDDFNPQFCRAVLTNFSTGNGFWRALFRAWMFHYNLESQQGQLVRKSLLENKSFLTDQQIKVVDTFDVLKTYPDRSKVSRQILDKEISNELLNDINFNDGVIGGKLSGAVLIEVARFCMKNSLTDQQLEALTALLCPLGTIHESLRDVALVSLIYALKDKVGQSDSYLRAKELVENNYQDPRMNGHTWPPVPEQLGGEKTYKVCVETVKQWHIFQSILLFFKLIGEVVEDEAHDHQFPQRERYWIDYFKQGKVSEAWVILGSKGAETANRYKLSGDSDFATLEWAKLSGGPPDQCALLLKIGAATIVEWSHSGACRIWKQDDSNAPKFFQNKYHPKDELRAPVKIDESDRIRHDPGGRWKQKITRRIDSYSGLRRFL